MSVTICAKYAVFHELKTALFTHKGFVPVEEKAEIFLDYANSSDFDPHYHLLVDQTEDSFPEKPYEKMRLLSHRLKPLFAARAPSSKTALICPLDSQFATSRLYQTVSGLNTQRVLEVFRGKAEALEFLGLDPTDPEILQKLWTDGADG